jgi:hypothetical protein
MDLKEIAASNHFYSRAQALKILQARTGRKFTKGIFSKSLRPDRVWCYKNFVMLRDIESFLEHRAKRQAVPPGQKRKNRLLNILLSLCRCDKSLERILKAAGAGSPMGVAISRGRSHVAWAVGYMIEARRDVLSVAAAPLPLEDRSGELFVESLTPKPESRPESANPGVR